jgi:hypothetical protein
MPKLFRNQRDALRLAKAGNMHYEILYGDPTNPRVVYAPEKPKRAAPVRDPRRVSEADVLKAVWRYLAHHPRVAWITRMQSGAAMMDFGKAGIRHLHFNRKRGMSDLLGQLRDGRIICVEVKAPDGELMDHQRDFLNEVRLHNGVAFVARSIDDAERELS